MFRLAGISSTKVGSAAVALHTGPQLITYYGMGWRHSLNYSHTIIGDIMANCEVVDYVFVLLLCVFWIITQVK